VTPVSRRSLDRSRAENQGWSGWTSAEVRRVISYSTNAKLRPLCRMTGSSSSTKASALMKDWIHVTRRPVVSWERWRRAGCRRYEHCRHRTVTVVLVIRTLSSLGPVGTKRAVVTRRCATSFYSVPRQRLSSDMGGNWGIVWCRVPRVVAGAVRECRLRAGHWGGIHGDVDSTKHQEQPKQRISVIFNVNVLF